MINNDLDRTDPTFIKDLLGSQRSVDRVAASYKKQGWHVEVPELRIRPTAAERIAYADKGDLLLAGMVQIKHRPGLHFHSIEEFPFATVIVDVAHTFDNATEKPVVYHILNADLTGMISVPYLAFPNLIRQPRVDGHAGRQRNFLECPKNLCYYTPLEP